MTVMMMPIQFSNSLTRHCGPLVRGTASWFETALRAS